MFGKCVYLYIFYCLSYEMDISTDVLQDQVSEERKLELNEEEDIILDEIRETHWSYVAQEGDDKKKIHSMRWEVYYKYKEEMIKSEFLLSVSYLKEGKVFGLV